MTEITKEALEKSIEPIKSLITKCEKAQLKLTEGSAQYSLLKNRIEALRVAQALIEREQELYI